MPAQVKRLKLDFGILDALRGIAALYVVINHCRGNLLQGGSELANTIPPEEWSMYTKLYYAILRLTSIGTEFVIIFFVLSGFSIMHSLMGKKNDPISFYKRRLIRLYPPYLTALVFAFLGFLICTSFGIQVLKGNAYSVFNDGITTLKNLFYIPKGALIPQFWSLTHEVIFYISIPIFCLWNIKSYISVSILGFVLGIIFNQHHLSEGLIIERFFFDYNIYFAIGILVYRNFDSIKKFFVLKPVAFFIILIGLFLMAVGVKYIMNGTNKITLLIATLMSILMIYNFLEYKINNKFLTFIGKISYTLYITHFASIFIFAVAMCYVLGIDYATLKTFDWVWIVGVLISVMLAIPLYYFAEEPTKKILNKLRK